MSDDSDDYTVAISRDENDDIKVRVLGTNMLGLMDDGQPVRLHSAGCTMRGDDDLRKLRDDIDRLLDEDTPSAAEDPDAGEIKRQVMAGAIGVVCNVDGAVHVHLTMDANDLERATAGVLIEVAQERIRQRVKWGNDHDHWRTEEQHDSAVRNDGSLSPDTWDGLHYHQWSQVSYAETLGVRRERLVEACAAYAAEIETIDRRDADA